MTLSDLKRGERGVIKSFQLEMIPLKLIEMGCLPGSEVEMIHFAPFSDPMYININGTHLAIRKETAVCIEVTQIY
ncbi:MAG: ferrous iron transport protein A [Bacteroidetes bacterium]|nr:ferrous iron transport protein A [Bacteroidota bacterium]